jgi:hypothetical protein
MNLKLALSIPALLASPASADIFFTDLGSDTGDVDLSYEGNGITIPEDGSGNGYGNGNTGSLVITDPDGNQVGASADTVFYGRFLWAPETPLDYLNFSTVVGGGRISFHSDNNVDQGGTRVRLFDTTGAAVPNIDADPSPTGTTLVVFRIEMSGPDRAGDEIVKIWYNPESFFDVAAGINFTGSGEVDIFDATNKGFGIHNPQIGGDAGSTQYDNIVFGDTAADVLPSGNVTPFVITAIDHDPEADTFRLTWNSQPGATYSLLYGFELQGFGADISDNIASQGEVTVFPPLSEPPFPNPTVSLGERASKLFFRVEKN